jgi:Rha family phage regulatory protein
MIPGEGPSSVDETPCGELPRFGTLKARTAGDGRIVTNSRDVAAFFGKRHDHVLRDIDALLLQAPACLPNFGEGFYTLPSTKMQQHRCFDMTRDGFMLLAMGFTGAKATGLKEPTGRSSPNPGHDRPITGHERPFLGHRRPFPGHRGGKAGHRNCAVMHHDASATDGREPPPRVRVTRAQLDLTIDWDTGSC